MRLDSEPAPAIQGGAGLSPEPTDGPSEAPRRFHRQLPRSGAPRAGLRGLRRDHGLARDRRRAPGGVFAPGPARMAAPRAARPRRAAGAGSAHRARRERLRARAAAPRAAPHRAHQRPLRLALRRPDRPEAGAGAAAEASAPGAAGAFDRGPRAARREDRRYRRGAAAGGAEAARQRSRRRRPHEGVSRRALPHFARGLNRGETVVLPGAPSMITRREALVLLGSAA